MDTSSNNPQMTLLRERVEDLAAYLEQWSTRSSATDRLAARAAGNMALERINAIANQLSEIGLQLTSELRTYEAQSWQDSGTGPGYTGRIIPPVEGLHDSGDDEVQP